MIPAIQEIGFGPGTEKAYATLHQATVSFAEMGERTISTQVRIDGDVVPDFDGWEVSFKGERFILNTKDPQAVKDNSTRNSLVDLTFVSWVVNELKRYFFFEPTSIDAGTAIADKYKASVNVPVEDFAVLFNKVLDYYFDGKVVFSLYMSGQGQYSTDRALVEIDYTYIWDVLVKFFEIYGVRWRIEHDNTNDVYTIKAGWPTTDIDINDHDFEYGYKGGLLRFERQVQDVDIHNILLGRGGEKNIPYRYFKRIDPQNPDWAADPDAIPELSNIYFDRLRDINFRWYVRGWMQNPSPNRDTSWDATHTYPTYSISPSSPYYWAYQKGLTDEKFNPVEYVKDDESIADYGEHWGALDDNDDIFPTIQGVTRAPLGRIDETVAVSEIVTDDIEAMAQNAAIEKSINRLTISLDGETETVFDRLSEEFTIPSGSTGNVTYVPVGTDEVNPGLVRFDTENSTVVAVADGTEYPIDALPAGTYRLKLHMVIARSGQATSATGTFGIENIVLTTSSMDTDAWKPTFDIWVKNIWGTTKGQDENDIQYAERVWLPILGDRAGNEAKIVFSTGFMSVSEDYEFTIVSYPVYDTSKSINGVPSEWRITLRKSDAEFDATGLYIPNASTGGQPIAGDKFFFIGIDMPFRYVELAEEDLNTNKEAQLDTEAAISPTWIMNLDKVRVHTLEDQEYGRTLADRLAAGGKVWIKDRRFTPGQRLQLYVQSITYTWNEPSDDSPYIVPDIEVVLSDKVVAVDSVVQRIQNDVSSIKNQYARISDVEAVVRSVAEPIFLKKTGESDSSDSPTQFSSKVTSKGFRQGAIGGTGWGIYRDNTSAFAADENEQPVQTRGTRSLRALRANVAEQEEEADAVIEADRIVVRKELQVNSLVINQIAYVGGKEIISAAKIEVSKVIETANGYICYFDQRRNSVANNFAVNDIAFGQVFNPDNTEQRYYKMVVTATDVDCITLGKSPKDGSGVPKVGDIIVQYGNTTNVDRQYVIVRDVIGGGYERMLSGLNSVSSTGKEYYFAGRQNNSGARWFVGDSLGDYAEYEDGVLTIKANVIFKAGQEIPGLSALETQVDNLEYLHTALPKSDTIISGGLILSKVIALRDSNNAIKSGINGDPTLSSIAAWYGGPMADKEATPTPASYAQSLFRFDGSGYLAGGNIFWNNQGYGGIPGVTWSRINGQDVVSIGANVQLESLQGADSSVTDLIDAVNSLADLFEVVNGNVHVKNNRGFYSDSFISAGGLSDSGGTAGGNASMQLISGGGRITNGTDTLDVYSMSRVDQLLASAGTVQTVAGVSPSNGDIPVASLQTALSLGAAAYKAVGSVVSGNTGLVTGGDVWTAIDNLPEPMVFKGSLGTGGTISSLPAASSANEGFTYKVITAGTYRGTAAKVGDTFISNGSSWILIPSGDEPEGTVTSVGLTMPTGFSVGSSPITSSGTLAVTFASGYSLPTTAKQSNWDTAYGWGNHANAGYLLATTAANTYATITALNGVSGRVTTLENRTNWDTYFGVDDDGNVYVKKNGNNPRGFYSYGFVSAGGASSGGGSAGVDLSAVWQSLKTNTDDYANQKINAYHIPIGTGLEIQNGLIVATNSGTVTGVSLAQGATNGTLHLVVNGTAQSDVAVTGLGSLAYKSSLVASDIPDLSATYQPKDADLTAIAGLTGTSGFLKKTAANTWSLDTNTYLTGITSTMVTNALGYTPANVTALADYVTLATAQTISGLKTITSGLRISGRAYSAGDDEGIVITWAGNDFATVSLGSHNSERSTFTIHRGSAPYWRYNNGTSAYNIAHPAKSGTIALTSDVSTAIEALDSSTEAVSSGYFLTGVTITDGKITARTQSNSISGSAGSLTTVSKTAWGRTYWTSGGVPDNVSGDMDDVGKMTFTAKTSKSTSGNVLEVVTIDGVTYLHSVLPFVSDSFISAGGVSSGGGSGGIDPSAMWAYLTNTASDTTYNNTKIAASHIPDVASTYGYLKSADLSGYVTLAGTETISGLKTFTSGLRVSGRAYSGGDDEGIVIGWAANAYATISLGSHNAERSTFSIHQGEAPKWVYNNGTTGYTITHPAKTGTIALTSDIPNVPSWAMASTKPSYTFAEITDKITHTNEFNFVPDAYDSYVYFNYRSSADTAVNVTKYIFSNGSATTGGRASVEASSFIKYGGTSAQFLKADGSVDSSTYLTGNQTITLSGDVSGSGATSISVSIGSGKVTNAMLAGSIANSKLSNSSITINGSSTSLGGSFSTASITAGTAGQSGASTGVSFSIPYVTMNKYGIVTAYGTHSHTISASDLTTTIGSTTYAPYNSAGYLPLSGGTLSNAAWGEALIINRASAGGESAIKFTSNGTLVGVIGVKTTMTPVFYPGNETSGSGYTIYHSGNSNKSDVAWTCSTLYASANVMAGAGAEGIYMNGTGICWHNSSNVWASDIIGFTSSGNVGIGTTAPAYKLDVNGTARFVESTPHIMRYYSAGTYTTGWYYGTNGNEALAFVANNAVTSFMFVQGASTKLDSWTNSTWTGVAPAMQIKQNCVYINSLIASGVSPSYQLYVNGNAVASGAITAGAASDARLKTNISTLSDSKAKALIMALRPVSFTWNDKATELYDQYKGDDLGFVAQEVENVLPIAIGTIFEKYKRLDQTKFIAPLVAVAKDHETRIEKLERENKELRKEVERLRMN